MQKDSVYVAGGKSESAVASHEGKTAAELAIRCLQMIRDNEFAVGDEPKKMAKATLQSIAGLPLC